ncbi:MAG: DUF1501 domain-containing protein [Planctomycetes bacterium]|nr:DUF1501 domain-containing protein [Planctomycetota bacterium]
MKQGCALATAAGLSPELLRAGPAAPRRSPARSVVQIFLEGGFSHLDSFDPKPEQAIEIRGEFGAIGTTLDGVRFAGTFRRSAEIAKELVLLRGFGHGEADHTRGNHSILTGYAPSPAIAYPSMGSVVAHELGAAGDLPAYICVPNDRIAHSGPGYLSTAFAPFSLGSDPGARGFKVRDLEAPGGLDAARIARRRGLLADLDAGFGGTNAPDTLRAAEAFHAQAYGMIDSPKAREAFELEREKPETRQAYAGSALGPRLLLARRLVEAGVRWITVNDGGWDHHRDLFRGARARYEQLDQAFATFVRDLAERGLLDQTLVLLVSEFGRTPRVNQDGGRDHWPKAYTVVAAGGGLKRGCAFGRSDERGSEPEEGAVRPADLAATVFHQLGIDPTKKLMSPGDRPIDLVREGRVLQEILA